MHSVFYSSTTMFQSLFDTYATVAKTLCLYEHCDLNLAIQILNIVQKTTSFQM